MFVCQGMATLILQKWARKIKKSSAQKIREIEGINFTDNCRFVIYIPSSSVYNKNVMENVHVLINSFHFTSFFFWPRLFKFLCTHCVTTTTAGGIL